MDTFKCDRSEAKKGYLAIMNGRTYNYVESNTAKWFSDYYWEMLRIQKTLLNMEELASLVEDLKNDSMKYRNLQGRVLNHVVCGMEKSLDGCS